MGYCSCDGFCGLTFTVILIWYEAFSSDKECLAYKAKLALLFLNALVIWIDLDCVINLLIWPVFWKVMIEQFGQGWDRNSPSNTSVFNWTWFCPANLVWSKLWLVFWDGAVVYWINFGTQRAGVVLWLPGHLSGFFFFISCLLLGVWYFIWRCRAIFYLEVLCLQRWVERFPPCYFD